jgi:hypothetical protein
MTSPRTRNSTPSPPGSPAPAAQPEAFEPAGAEPSLPPSEATSRPGRIRRAIERAAAAGRAAHRASVPF